MISSLLGTALVTGGSRGLGAAIAKALAKEGWSVAVNYSRDDGGARAVVEEIVSGGGRASMFRFDVRDTEGSASAIRSIEESLGPIAVLVNNATGCQPELTFDQQSWSDYAEQLDFALKAPFELLKLVLPGFRARGRGVVINIGSEVIDIGNTRAAHYVAAKAALLGATRSWARELAGQNITVNMVSPGWIPVERHAETTQERKARYLDQVPMRHFGCPEDVASSVVFLASDRARFITGQRITVNGGRTFS